MRSYALPIFAFLFVAGCAAKEKPSRKANGADSGSAGHQDGVAKAEDGTTQSVPPSNEPPPTPQASPATSLIDGSAFVADSVSENITLSTTLKSLEPGAEGGLVFFAQNDDSGVRYLAVGLNSAGVRKFAVIKMDGDKKSMVYSAPLGDGDHKVKTSIVGNRMRIYLDNVLVYYKTADVTGGKFGIWKKGKADVSPVSTVAGAGVSITSATITIPSRSHPIFQSPLGDDFLRVNWGMIPLAQDSEREPPVLGINSLSPGTFIRITAVTGQVNWGGSSDNPTGISPCTGDSDPVERSKPKLTPILQVTNSDNQVVDPGVPTPSGSWAITPAIPEIQSGFFVPLGGTKIFASYADSRYSDNRGMCRFIVEVET